jgi:hypothetical protein
MTRLGVPARFRWHHASDQELPPLDPAVVALKDEKENQTATGRLTPLAIAVESS